MSKNKSGWGILGLAALFAVTAAGPASATLYDLQADWSNSSNGTGVWAYRAGTTILPSSIANWQPSQPTWAPGSTGGHFLPAWFKSGTDATGGGLDWRTGDIVVHTTDAYNGIGMGDANVMWTSPTDGLAHISGGLWDARTSLNRAQHWQLLINGILYASGNLAGNNSDPYDRSHPASFDLNDIKISAGDQIVLWISRLVPAGDFVGVNLSIDLLTKTEVPEPEPVKLMGLGLLALGAVHRWRRGRSAR